MSAGDRPAQPPLGVLEVLLMVALTLACVASVGAVAVSRLGAAGVLLAELGFVLLPTVIWLWARAVPLPALGLGELAPDNRLRLLPLAGALIAGLGAFYVLAAVIEPWIERLYPTPPALRDALEHMILGGRPLYVDLFTMALAPAIAEELLFRGALYEVIERRMNPAAAIVIAAIAFALYHGSPHRFAPALAGGLLLGAVRARSRSLLPAIVFHASNNAGVIVLLRLGYRDPPQQMLPLLLAALALAGGFALLSRPVGAGCRP